MQYFELTWNADPKVVGVRDGLGPCFLDKEFYKRHKWLEDIFVNNKYDQKSEPLTWWIPLAKMPDFGGALQRIPMEKAAKLTDFIDFSGFSRGYLVNEKLRNILEKAHLPRHCYFPVTFQKGSQEIGGYWWLCYDLETGENNVDFSTSSFKASSFDKEEIAGDVSGINSYADYMGYFNKHKHAIRTSKLQLTSTFDTELDIWGAQFLTLNKGYISDRLLNLFIEHNVTGYSTRRPQYQLSFG